MGEARKHNGVAIVAYVNGKAVDSEGDVIVGAPKPPADTPANQQLGAAGAPTSEERIGIAIAQAIINPAAVIAKAQMADAANAAAAIDETDDDDEDDGSLPKVDDLAAHLADITDVDEVKALRRSDRRKTAKPIYEARIAELERA